MKTKPLCSRCEDRLSIAKSMCARCYYATSRGYLTSGEQCLKRNFLRAEVGVLTGKNGTEYIVDKEDFENVKNHLWCSSSGYAFNPTLGLLHRFLLPNVKIVDHKNRNIRDNRRSNLRDGTYFNTLNTITRRKSVSGYNGVHRFKDKWQARINHKHERHYLGTFNKPEDAAQAVALFAQTVDKAEFYPSVL